MLKSKLAQAVGMAMAGAMLSAGSVSSANAHTMYNTYVGSPDGWNYGNLNLQHPTVTPGWVGTASSTTLPFGYAGKSALNWAAEIHGAGNSLEISQADATARYTQAVDLDTNKGSWQDAGGLGYVQGWAHNTDIGLIRSHVTTEVKLNLTNITNTQWSNFGITVYEGMDTGAGFSHHSSWNCPTCDAGSDPGGPVPYNANNPFGTTGLTYLTHSDAVDSVNGLIFTAQADQVYTIYLGGKSGEGVFAPTVNYKLNIQAVPIPAAVWLFGSALAGLGVFGRRRGKAGASA
jgi:hypothetical protein